MTPMAWTVLGLIVAIVALLGALAAALDGKRRAETRVTWLEAYQAKLIQARAEQAAAAEMHRDNLPRLINRLEAYRQGAPARRLEGE